MGEIIIEVLGFIAYVTGELILTAITLGRHKPSLPHAGTESVTTKELHAFLSTSLGIIFWGGLLVLTAWLISR